MQILPITISYSSFSNNPSKYIDKNMTHSFNNPSFGYCEPHMRIMRTVNQSVKQSFEKNFAEYKNAQQRVYDYKSRLEQMEQLHKKAAQLVTQYANYEYSMAEVIPSYALESAPELMAAIRSTQIFKTPQDILLTIANIPKLETKAGIDQNTGKVYTQEQMRKSRANSQLYSTAIMLDLLDKSILENNLGKDELSIVSEMRKEIANAIESVYGKDAYAKIQKLKMMGADASIEDKRASLNLLQEFDNCAKDLDFGRDFYVNLDRLLKHRETFGTDIQEAFKDRSSVTPAVTLRYHTHPQIIENNHTHDHNNTYSHQYMHEHGIEHIHYNGLQANLIKK